MQDAFAKQDDILLKAVTGLEGGCVANGSTCGIATGGALGIGLRYEDKLPADPEWVMNQVGAYMDWFRSTHGTTQCRERNQIDFHKTAGQLKYFLSLRKMLRCINMAGRSLQVLTGRDHSLLETDKNEPVRRAEEASMHCAQEVLKQVRLKTGVGNPRLEAVSVVLDGGVGLRGQLCGAVAGSVLALNLLHGFDIRKMGYLTNVRKFLIGHINLIRRTPGKKPETFFIGKEMVNRFRDQAGPIDCRAFVGRRFTGMDDFSCFINESQVCRERIQTAAEITVQAIQAHPPSASSV